MIVNQVIERPKEIVNKSVEDYGNFGYFSVDEIRSPMNLPPFRCSLKDGYAMRSADGNSDRLTMPKQIAAGESDCDQLKANYCYRINTGKFSRLHNVDSFFELKNAELFIVDKLLTTLKVVALREKHFLL